VGTFGGRWRGTAHSGHAWPRGNAGTIQVGCYSSFCVNCAEQIPSDYMNYMTCQCTYLGLAHSRPKILLPAVTSMPTGASATLWPDIITATPTLAMLAVLRHLRRWAAVPAPSHNHFD
jgi:hypothetical protein